MDFCPSQPTSRLSLHGALLVDNFNYGDQIFLFGLSRGVYTVRSLAGLIGLVGPTQKVDIDYFCSGLQDLHVAPAP